MLGAEVGFGVLVGSGVGSKVGSDVGTGVGLTEGATVPPQISTVVSAPPVAAVLPSSFVIVHEIVQG